MGEQVTVSLPDESEEVLRAVVESFLGKEVKKTLKKFTNQVLKK